MPFDQDLYDAVMSQALESMTGWEKRAYKEAAHKAARISAVRQAVQTPERAVLRTDIKAIKALIERIEAKL